MFLKALRFTLKATETQKRPKLGYPDLHSVVSLVMGSSVFALCALTKILDSGVPTTVNPCGRLSHAVFLGGVATTFSSYFFLLRDSGRRTISPGKRTAVLVLGLVAICAVGSVGTFTVLEARGVLHLPFWTHGAVELCFVLLALLAIAAHASEDSTPIWKNRLYCVQAPLFASLALMYLIGFGIRESNSESAIAKLTSRGYYPEKSSVKEVGKEKVIYPFTRQVEELDDDLREVFLNGFLLGAVGLQLVLAELGLLGLCIVHRGEKQGQVCGSS